MYIRSSKNRTKPARRVVAEEEIDTDTGSVSVDPEATELVFETEDVAELIAEVTGSDVEVVADENEVKFTVGDTDYTVQAEGNEEVLEASTSVIRRNAVRASTRRNPARSVAASRQNQRNGRVVRNVNRK